MTKMNRQIVYIPDELEEQDIIKIAEKVDQMIQEAQNRMQMTQALDIVIEKMDDLKENGRVLDITWENPVDEFTKCCDSPMVLSKPRKVTITFED